jgi:hypothetical protein
MRIHPDPWRSTLKSMVHGQQQMANGCRTFKSMVHGYSVPSRDEGEWRMASRATNIIKQGHPMLLTEDEALAKGEQERRFAS